MPKIVCGSSAGSLLAAVLCTLKFDELHVLKDHSVNFGRSALGWNVDSLWDNIKAMFQSKPLASTDVLKNFIRD